MKFYDINGNEKTDLQVIQDTGWTELNAYVKYRKVNGIVYVRGYRESFVFNSGKNIVATLPQTIIPEFFICENYTLLGGGDRGNMLTLESNGTITLYVGTAGIGGYGFSISYPV